MCGRYNIIDDPLLHALLDSLGVDIGPLPTRYNIAPTEAVPVVHELDGQRHLTLMRWWLVPHWSDGPSEKYAMFNARSETLAKSRAYRGPYKYRRCVLPASSFIEWTKTSEGKQPYIIEAVDQALALAGLWDCWHEELFSCAIVTTAAAQSFEPVHQRMPVMLNSEGCELWLRGSTDELQPLFEPTLAHPLKITAASRSLNNARNKDAPELLEESREIH